MSRGLTDRDTRHIKPADEDKWKTGVGKDSLRSNDDGITMSSRSHDDGITTSSTLLRKHRSVSDASEARHRGGISAVDGSELVGVDEVEGHIDELFRRFCMEQQKSGREEEWLHIPEDEPCQRCGKKVYPVERVDVGALYHRTCFRCFVCDRQLTLMTFQRELDLREDCVREVFCNQHIPQHAANLDADAVAIRGALDAQRIRQSKGAAADSEPGFLYEVSESRGYHYAKHATLNASIKRRATLRSFSDFERHGVFAAQIALEQLHRSEENQLYAQMAAARDKHLARLDELLAEDEAYTRRQLADWGTARAMSQAQLNGALRRLAALLHTQHGSQRELLLSRLASHEQAAVARMVEKHSREMLNMIQVKERAASIAEEEQDLSGDKDEMLNTTERESHKPQPTEPPPSSNLPAIDRTPASGLPSSELDDEVYEAPERLPPVAGKEEIIGGPEEFQCIDEYALEEARRTHETFTDLVRRLTQRCEGELQRVRAIFRWITIKNLDEMEFSGDVEADSPLGILRGIKHGTESYHDLFKRLCSYAGLHCEIIDGVSKGAGYRPSARLTQAYRNQWTAVWLEGVWRFINCKWGARHVTGASSGQYTYECDEFYFLTDPEHHVFQHFPDDPAWQLLHRPLSLQEFKNLPVVKSPFFTNHVSFCASYEAIITTATGQVELRLHCRHLLPFAAKLKAKSPTEVPAQVLEGRTLIRTISKEVVVTANLPCPAHYYLDVFVASHWNMDSMNNACTFHVHCTQISDHAGWSYPQVGMIGPTPYFSMFGMAEDKHMDPFVVCHGEAVVTVRLTKDIKIAHALKRWDPRDATLSDYDRFAFLRHRNDTRCTFLVRCPRRGQYILSLYASVVDGLEDEMPCVHRYYIECEMPVLDACALPRVTRRWRDCRLLEPLQGDLTIHTDVEFRLESQRALAMAVSVEGTWNALAASDGRFQGTVNTGATAGKALVYGRFDPSQEKYIPLLEYRLVPARSFDHVT